MNTIMTISSLLLAFSVSMSSFGMMSSAVSLKKPRSVEAKMKPCELAKRHQSLVTVQRYFGDAQQKAKNYFESKEKNRKLLTGLCPFQLPLDIIGTIGNYLPNDMSRTCKDMNNRFAPSSIKTARAFCNGKKRWMSRVEMLNFIFACDVVDLQRMVIGLPNEILEKIQKHYDTAPGKIGLLKRYKDFENMMLGTRGYSDIFNDLNFDDIDKSLDNLREKRFKNCELLVEQNNKDCLKAFSFAMALNDTDKLVRLLRNNKKYIKNHVADCSSLYRDWLIKGIQHDSQKNLEFLFKEDPFDCKNHYDDFDDSRRMSFLMTTAVVASKVDFAFCKYEQKEKRFINLGRKHGFPYDVKKRTRILPPVLLDEIFYDVD